MAPFLFLFFFFLVSKEKFEDTKRVTRSRKSQKDRQYNGQKKKDKQWSTKHYTETKDGASRTPLKTRSELRSSHHIAVRV